MPPTRLLHNLQKDEKICVHVAIFVQNSEIVLLTYLVTYSFTYFTYIFVLFTYLFDYFFTYLFSS